MISKKQAVKYIAAASLLTMLLTAVLCVWTMKYALPQGTAVLSAEEHQSLDELAGVIERQYLSLVPRDELAVNAQRGMVAGLNDKYSAFYTKEEYQQLTLARSGEYKGIGILLSQRPDDGVMQVLEVYPDTPAAKAGIKAHDVLVAVGERETQGMDVESVALLIRDAGQAGIILRVRRDGAEMEFAVSAETVVVPQVEWRMMQTGGRNIGYIKIKQFMGDAREGFLKALGGLQAESMQALVIDLRNNPGGDLQMVVDMTDELVPAGLILSERSRSGKVREFRSDADWVGVPMAVIVNAYSASASEIMAGAVQDYGVGKVVGMRTYGKGVVQTVFPLSKGDYVKLTTASYFTPKGRDLHGVGVGPDVEAELSEEAKGIPLSELTPQQDAQLQAALAALEF